jgi:hypothetical protein
MLPCPPTLDSDKCGPESVHSEAFQKSVSDAMKVEPVRIWTDDMTQEQKIQAEADLRQRVLNRIVHTPGTPCAGLVS